MVTMFARHKVNNYDTWKQAYDNFAVTRQQNGVQGATVHRDASDPNIVMITHVFNDLNAASTFAASEELKSAMMEAGVVGPPDIWFTEDVEQTAY